MLLLVLDYSQPTQRVVVDRRKLQYATGQNHGECSEWLVKYSLGLPEPLVGVVQYSESGRRKLVYSKAVDFAEPVGASRL